MGGSGLECLKTTKKLINNPFSRQHLKFLTSWVWIKLWKIRHRNWEDVCFILLQLAAGQLNSSTIANFVSTYVTPQLSSFTAFVNSGSSLATSAIQQLNGNMSAATQSLSAAMTNAPNSAQQYANSMNLTAQQAQGCLSPQTAALSAINSSASK